MIFFFGRRPRPGRLAAADERERERDSPLFSLKLVWKTTLMRSKYHRQMDVCRRPQIVFTNTLLCTTTDLRLDYCIIIMIVLQTRKKERTSVTSASKQLLLLYNRDLFKESVLHSGSRKKPIEQQKQTLPVQRRKKKKKRKKDCRSSSSFFSSRMMISTSSDDGRCSSSELSLSLRKKKN